MDFWYFFCFLFWNQRKINLNWDGGGSFDDEIAFYYWKWFSPKKKKITKDRKSMEGGYRERERERERKRNSFFCFDDVTHTQSSTHLRGYELFRQGSEKFKWKKRDSFFCSFPSWSEKKKVIPKSFFFHSCIFETFFLMRNIIYFFFCFLLLSTFMWTQQ